MEVADGACILRADHQRVRCPGRAGTTCSTMVLSHVLSVPYISPAGPLSPLALTGSHKLLRRDYTFQSEDDLKGYWAHLEQICCTSAR